MSSKINDSIELKGSKYGKWVLGLIVVNLAVRVTGSIFSLALLAKAPLLLVALNPISRHMIFAAPLLDLVPFTAVASSRLLFHVFLAYLLGRIYGERGIAWLEQKYPQLGYVIRFIEKYFNKAPVLFLFAMPGTPISLLSGNGKMHAAVFLPVALAGILIRVLIVYGVADWLKQYLMPIIEFVRAHWLILTAGVIVIYATLGFLRRRRRRK